MIVEVILYALVGTALVSGAGALAIASTSGRRDRGADIETIVVKIAAPPAPNPLAAIEAHEAHLAAGSPYAFWLDYARKAVAAKPVERPWPNCPSCGTSEYHQVLTEHAGVATSWSCTLCGTDFTRRGKIGGFAARKARKERATRIAYKPPAVETRKKKHVYCGCGKGPPHVEQEHLAAMAARDRHIETQNNTAAILNALNTLDEIDYLNDMPPPPAHRD